jgi:hypothetical protein
MESTIVLGTAHVLKKEKMKIVTIKEITVSSNTAANSGPYPTKRSL